ncbi:uncharacterized protein M421DRAFT_112372 [Didymella exigua CBS 183.55]|uniref:BTB domain-containing protein n=1 Tax=Didymella exigua CBS 183.55 TaxID=1150837 RepID=A0A6A5S078_9PLEO|nr:uncharacterized protein M421DRAFT_112372 [Didymella exigua CBS 183.55]KAF1934081.1 hypothetical protein M421DRAFT_112372 [Didymella exigua CBS 183.55]
MTESTGYVSFEDFVQSDLFTFHVGEEKRRFVVHSKAVVGTSSFFDRLVNGGLKESHDRSAEIEDVDPETFTRFLEYAYRRDYTVPSSPEASIAPVEKANSSKINLAAFQYPENSIAGAESASSEDVNWGGGGWNSNSAPSAFSAMSYTPSVPSAPLVPSLGSQKKAKKHARVQMSPRAVFNNRQYIQPAQDAPSLLRARFEPYPNTSPTQSFESIFLAHARLYTLADMRMVHPLRDLALHKLHKTLVAFELYPERLGDVVELARYAYEHGEDRSEEGRIDALREMVVNYIACEMKVLGKHDEFRNLMDGGGEFAGDFWDIVSQELL